MDQNQECKWWQLRWVGRSFGASLFSAGLIGAVAAFFKFNGPHQGVMQTGTVFGSSILAISGIWLLRRKYWNDPSELAEERKKFINGQFMEFYRLHGIERLIKIAGRELLRQKLSQEMEGMGLYLIFVKYQAVILDVILREELVSHNELLLRFTQDQETSTVPAIKRFDCYGKWIVKNLNVSQETVLHSISACPTTAAMTFFQLCEFSLKSLYEQGFLQPEFLRRKIIPELEHRWVDVQQTTGGWWLDLGLILIPEVQFYFNNTWRREHDVEQFVKKFWNWPISKHSTLLPNPTFHGLQKIYVDYTSEHNHFTQKEAEIRNEYSTVESKLQEQLRRSIADIEDSWDLQKANIRSMYSDNEAKYNAQVAQERRGYNQRITHANEAFERQMEEPKKKKTADLKALNENHKLILSQIQHNYERMRLNDEPPRPIVDPTNPVTFLPSLYQQPAVSPVINVNIINNSGSVVQ